MAQSWDAEFAVTDELAARLIASQFPDLGPVHLEFLGAGFDNSAYLVNGQWVFRFPRRTMGVELIEIETRILPQVVLYVPLLIPAPSLIGRPVPEFPYPFAGYQKIPGETADRLNLPEAACAQAAPLLAHFLKALHAVSVDAPPDLIRRADLGYRIPWLRERLDRSEHLHPAIRVLQIKSFLDDLAAQDLGTAEPVLVHGDLYARHLIFDGEQLTGVIDWGDVHRGDPALDLSIVYSFLPPSARELFWNVYGPVSPETEARAQFRAVLYGILLTDYGTDVGDEAIVRAGSQALENLFGPL